MKRQFFAVIGIAMLSILSFNCNTGGSGSGEAYTLKLKLDKGDKFGHDMDMDITSGFEIEGRKMDMKMNLKGGTAFEVKDVTPESKEIAMTYTSMKTSVVTSGMGVEGDAVKNEDAGEKIVGKTVTMKLNNQNQIVDVAGFDQILADPSMDDKTKEQMEKMFSKEQLNSLFSMMFQMYPDKPVKVGDSWEKENDMSVAGIAMKMLGKYTLVSVKDGIGSIDMEGAINGKGSMNTGGGNVEMDMNGGQKGRIDITMSNGYIKGSDIKMDIKADMKVMEQTIPMVVKGFYILKGK